MKDKRSRILRFSLGIMSAIALVAASVLTSIFAPHLAMIVDPFFISISLIALGIAAHAAGYKLGGVFIEKQENQQDIPNVDGNHENGKENSFQVVHLYHHYPEKKSLRFFSKSHSSKSDAVEINQTPTHTK